MLWREGGRMVWDGPESSIVHALYIGKRSRVAFRSDALAR